MSNTKASAITLWVALILHQGTVTHLKGYMDDNGYCSLSPLSSTSIPLPCGHVPIQGVHFFFGQPVKRERHRDYTWLSRTQRRVVFQNEWEESEGSVFVSDLMFSTDQKPKRVLIFDRDDEQLLTYTFEVKLSEPVNNMLSISLSHERCSNEIIVRPGKLVLTNVNKMIYEELANQIYRIYHPDALCRVHLALTRMLLNRRRAYDLLTNHLVLALRIITDRVNCVWWYLSPVFSSSTVATWILASKCKDHEIIYDKIQYLALTQIHSAVLVIHLNHRGEIDKAGTRYFCRNFALEPLRGGILLECTDLTFSRFFIRSHQLPLGELGISFSSAAAADDHSEDGVTTIDDDDD